MQLRPVLLATGIMTALVGLAMVPSALIDIADGHEDWGVFAISAFGTIFIGVCLALLVGQEESHTGPARPSF